MSEPGAGSDLAGIKTTAVRDGDDYVINGAKTLSVAGSWLTWSSRPLKTDPTAGHKGISLIAVDAGTPGFTKGRKLDKIGLRSADTAELSYQDVRVPATNLIGEENRGFYHLMRNLPAERLGIAIHAVAQARRAVELTMAYAQDRKAFGQPIGTFQVNRHAIADMSVLIDVMQVYIDRCITAVNAGELTAEEAAGAKMWATEQQWQIIDAAFSCTAGMGTSTSTRSPGSGATPGSSGSTAAPARSCETSSDANLALETAQPSRGSCVRHRHRLVSI